MAAQDELEGIVGEQREGGEGEGEGASEKDHQIEVL